jgi:hypothetical protein
MGSMQVLTDRPVIICGGVLRRRFVYITCGVASRVLNTCICIFQPPEARCCTACGVLRICSVTLCDSVRQLQDGWVGSRGQPQWCMLVKAYARSHFPRLMVLHSLAGASTLVARGSRA